MNRQHFEFEKSIRFNVSNETLKERKVLLKWQIRNASSEVLEEHEETFEVPALSAVWKEKVLLPEIDVFNEYVSYQAFEDGVEIADGSVIFSYPKFFHYQNPHLAVRVEGDELVITSQAYAKSVEILNENEDLLLEDNYFDMNAGERRVKIVEGNTEGLRIRSVYDI